MVILGLLASLVAPNLFKRVDTAKVRTAESQIQLLSTAIDTYRLDVGKFPQALNELVNSEARGWDGPYIPRIPLDPWDEPYHYRMPGEHGSYDIYSNGGDSGSIIANWVIEQ